MRFKKAMISENGRRKYEEILIEYRVAEPSWKDVELSDWSVRFHEKIYPIHTSIVARGPRKSDYFLSEFTTKYKIDGDYETDLSEAFPERYQPVWESKINCSL